MGNFIQEKVWSDKKMHLGNKTSNMYVNSHQTHLFNYKELLIFGLICKVMVVH